jgi:hypothetical protein
MIDKKLLIITSAIAAISAYKLYEVAIVTGNWKGMYFTLIHIGVVAFGALYAIGLRNPSSK